MKATNVPKGAAVNEIVGYPEFLVPGPTPEEHLKEMRAKYTPGKVNVASKMR